MKVRKLKRSWEDLSDHFFAFLIDFCYSVFPAYIWSVIFLLILQGVVSPRLFDLLLYASFAGMCVIGVLLLSTTTAKTQGQSWGGAMTGIRLVDKKGRKATPNKLMLRQAFSVGIPIIAFGYLFQTPGILAWFILNAFSVLFSAHQQNIIDRFLSLMWVKDLEDAELPNIC